MQLVIRTIIKKKYIQTPASVIKEAADFQRCFSENATMSIHTSNFVIYPSPRDVSDITDDG